MSPNLSPTTPVPLSCIISRSSKGHLHGSQRVLKAWSMHELPSRAPPLRTKFLPASAGKAFSMGHTRFAVLLLVAFHAFLRTQELFVGPGKPFLCSEHPAPQCCCLFPPPKQVSDSRMLLKWWSSAMPLSSRTSKQWCPNSDQAKGFGRKAQLLFQIFAKLCIRTRLRVLSWRPYSLRRGRGHSALPGMLIMVFVTPSSHPLTLLGLRALFLCVLCSDAIALHRCLKKCVTAHQNHTDFISVTSVVAEQRGWDRVTLW